MSKKLFNTTLQSITLNLLDMTGRLTIATIHTRSFDVYDQKYLVLLRCIPQPLTPEYLQQISNFTRKVGDFSSPGGTQAANAQRALITTLQDSHRCLVSNWADLMEHHHPHHVYQLRPRKCKNVESYSVVEALTSEQGSPYSLDHREDPYEFRYVFKETENALLTKFNESPKGLEYQKSVQTGAIFYDAILNSRNAVALISYQQSHSERFVYQNLANVAFLKEYLVHNLLAAKIIRDRWRSIIDKPINLVCAGAKMPSPAVRVLAAKYSVLLYAKDGHRFRYVPPMPLW